MCFFERLVAMFRTVMSLSFNFDLAMRVNSTPMPLFLHKPVIRDEGEVHRAPPSAHDRPPRKKYQEFLPPRRPLSPAMPSPVRVLP